MSTEVVLVHGLWVRTWAMERLARQVGNAGFHVRKFNYKTTTQELDRQSRALFEFSIGKDGALPNFIAHSMGGLITLHMLAQHAETPCGRIVLMGSPVQGSQVARNVSRWPAGSNLLGQATNTLTEGAGEWPEGREIGMIAGTRAFGLGVLAGGRFAQGDGTVLAGESHHEQLHDHVEIPTTHTGMLVSAEAARQAIEFLRTGHFFHN